MNQTKLESRIEITLNYLSGFILAYFIYKWVVLPNEFILNSPFTATIIFTIVSIIRSYYWRRLFNAGIHKQLHKALTKIYR